MWQHDSNSRDVSVNTKTPHEFWLWFADEHISFATMQRHKEH